MALLNPPEVVPAVMKVIHDYLLYKGLPIARDELEETVCPPTVTPTGQAVFKASLQAALDIRLVEDADGGLTASADIQGSFARVLRKKAFAGGINDVTAPSDKGASDLSRSLAWFLAQDVYKGVEPWSSNGPRGVQRLQQDQFKDLRAFQNDTRWTSFIRWAPALDLAEFTPSKKLLILMPDPTKAIEEEIPGVFGKQKRLAMGDFLQRLSDEIPVLDRGSLKSATISLTELSEDEGTVSFSVGHALRRLHARGVVELQSLADAPQFMLQGSNGQKDGFSHVELRKRA